MRTYVRLLLLALITCGFVGCSKEKSIDSTDAGGPGILKMKVDGQQWVANKFASATIMNGFTSIMGSSNDGKDLIITLDTKSTGTYQLDQNSNHAAAYVDNNEAAPVSYTTNQGMNAGDAGGTVTITSIDEVSKKISGTFNFKMTRDIDGKSIMVTEGSFTNLTYTTELPPTGNNGNTLKVTIDGTDWTGKSVVGIFTSLTNSISIVASELDGSKGVGLTVPADIKAGTYPFSGITGTVMGQYNVGTTFYLGESGQLVITEHDTGTKTIKGTFNFDGKVPGGTATSKLTNGSFTVKYQ